MSTRIVVGGQEKCGKSTLCASLFRRLQRLGVDVSLHEIDLNRLREFSVDVRTVVLGDLPCDITGIKDELSRLSDAAIVVAKDPGGLAEWHRFFVPRRIPILFDIVSYQDRDDAVDHWREFVFANDHVFVGNLEKLVIESPEIRFVADKLVYALGVRAAVRAGAII